MLVLIAGLPGTGKTTVARGLAAELGATVLSTDAIRQEIFDEPAYDDEGKRRVYDEMLRVAKDLLRDGKRVILDGTFHDRDLRAKASRLGKRTGRKVLVVETVLPEDKVRSRLHARREAGEDRSEADYEVHLLVKRSFQPIRRKHYTVDTSGDEAWRKRVSDLANKLRVAETRKELIDKLRRRRDSKLLQTHISWILLDGQHAFKIKKPVDLGFVDYRTLERREHFCHREVEINSKLSPGLYRGVVPIGQRNGAVVLDDTDTDEIVDYAVKMVEVPQTARMDKVLRRGEVDVSRIHEIAGKLWEFHCRTPVAKPEHGSTRAIRAIDHCITNVLS